MGSNFEIAHNSQFTSKQKDKNTAIVLETLLAVRPNDMPAIVKSLSPTQLDTLMKYIYRGMAQPEAYNSGLLLTWHEKVGSADFGGQSLTAGS